MAFSSVWSETWPASRIFNRARLFCNQRFKKLLLRKSCLQQGGYTVAA
jgi:hypothetical protein